MRKLILFFAIAISCITANAQHETGKISLYPQIGMDFAKFSNFDIYDINDNVTRPKFKTGFTAGIEAQTYISQPIAISIGALYCKGGCKWDDLDIGNEGLVAMKYSQDALQFPLMAHLCMPEGFAFSAGIKLNWILNTEFIDNQEPSNSMSGNADALFRRTTIAIPVGASYEYSNVRIALRYDIPLCNAAKKDLLETRQNMFTLTLGYRIDIMK